MDSGSTVKLTMVASEAVPAPSSLSPQAVPRSARSASAIQPTRILSRDCDIHPPNEARNRRRPTRPKSFENLRIASIRTNDPSPVKGRSEEHTSELQSRENLV